jgi:hypothetical protein
LFRRLISKKQRQETRGKEVRFPRSKTGKEQGKESFGLLPGIPFVSSSSAYRHLQRKRSEETILQWVRDGLTSAKDIAQELSIAYGTRVSKGLVIATATQLVRLGKLRKKKGRWHHYELND